MASVTTIDGVFKEAHQSFLRSLSPDERTLFSTCASAENLLADARQLEIISKNRTRGRRFMQRITAISKTLVPYFEVVGITVQTTEYAALAWGGIRLILQLASNFTTFFDKLTRTLERLANHIPQYDLVIRMYKGRYLDEFAQRIAYSLGEVYMDIFQFLQSVARVFSKEDGKNKHRPLVLASLAWKPFDSRFDEILQQMESHRTILNEVLDLDHKQANFDAREKMEKAWQAAEREHDNAERARNSQDKLAQKAEIEQQAQKEERRKAEIARLEQVEHRFAQERERRLAETTMAEARRAQDAIGKDVENIIQAQRDALSLRIRNWLSPPEFAQSYENALNSREDDTAEWLLDDAQFIAWRSRTSSRAKWDMFEQECLWIKGNPGYGKTVLAGNIVFELKNEAEDAWNQNGTTPDILYFFFRSTVSTMDSSAAAFRALLSQILHTYRQDNDFMDKFIFSMNETSSGQMIASEDEIFDLLRICMRCSDQCSIVLDGIDECRDSETLIHQLLRLKQESKVKLLLFSRPNVVPLSRAMPIEQQLLIGRRTSGDIKIYLMRKVTCLQDDGLLPRDVVAGSLVDHLLTGADGMFLWARLMISYLKCPALSRAQRVEVIENVILPEGLESMYERIGDLIGQGYQVQRNLVKKIIIFLSFTERRLTTRELRSAITTATNSVGATGDVSDIVEFEEMVVMTCAGLVETERLYSPIHGRMSTFFRFIHLSASEYFSSNTNHFNSVFATTSWDAHVEIACTCLTFLTTQLPAQPLGGTIGAHVSKESLNDTFPFCNYAVVFWSLHLEATKCDITHDAHNTEPAIGALHRLLLRLSTFVSHGLLLMSWMEARYIYGVPPSFARLKQWASWANGLTKLYFPDDNNVLRLHNDILDLSRYLPELDEYWGPKLIAAPECIWEEVTTFTPCRLLPQSSTTKVHSLVAEELSNDYLSTQALCKVSESTSDGLLVAVLSIWPSREYQSFTQQKKTVTSLKALRELSMRWIARYEIWSTASVDRCIVDHRFTLDSMEVWLQMKQTMCHREENCLEDITSGWGMQFPMAISKNGRTFTVLRTLYSLKPATSKPGLVLESSVLNMEFEGIKSPHWFPEFENIPSDDVFFSSSELDEHQRFQRRDLYLYWFFFHPDSMSLLFVSQDLQSQSMAVVFGLQTPPQEVVLNQGKLNITGHVLRHPSWCRNFNQVKVIYHQRCPLLGFSFAGRLYLWAFKNALEKPYALCDIDADSDIKFHPNGTDIILLDPIDSRQIRKPIPYRLLQFQQLIATFNHPSTDLEAGRWAKGTRWTNPNHGINNLQLQRATSSTSMPTSNADQAPFQIYHSRQNDLYVRLREHSGSLGDSRELIKLPSWADSARANINTRIPESRDEMIKIILNKAAKPWYGMSDPVDTHLPAVIQPDLQSLMLPGAETAGIQSEKKAIEDAS